VSAKTVADAPRQNPRKIPAAETEDDTVLVTTLTPVQRKILRLLGLTPADYGH
jgi:hypothetical protein